MMAQEEFTHYYIKIDGSDIENLDIELGIVDYDKEYNPKQSKLENVSTLSQLNDAISASMEVSNTSKQLNILIHGIWGDNTFAWKEMVRNLSRDVYSTDDGKKKVLLSIVWNSSINYLTGVKIARKKGDFLGPFFKELVDRKLVDTKLSFLCHSMGNRIFQHLMHSSGLIENGEQVVDHYIAAGADIESEIFDEGKSLENLSKVVKDVTIYVHNNDRSLKMSKLVNKNKRLGLNGLDPYAMPENFSIIDVSVISDHVNFTTSMSNHRYFYMSPTVVKDIKRIVWSKDYVTQKKRLDHPRRLKLMPEEF
tara:strand:+ start:824 stop:1747 length:924 start_codon:yes stop_codon:yes gene_type:complete